MTAPDLLPCPFCGHHPHLWGDTSGEYQIECVNGSCPSEPSVWMPEKEDAIAAWNTRPAPLAEALAVPEVAAMLGDMLEFLRGLPPDASSGGHCNRDLRARIKQAMLGQSPLRAIGEGSA